MKTQDHLQVPWAFRDGLVVHVDEVERGLGCACNCVSCGMALIARQGDVRIHHFAHATGRDCPGYLETMIHLLAKHFIRTGERFWVPPLRELGGRRPIFKGRYAQLLNLRIEASLDCVRPDVIFTYEADHLAVEIAVTHRVGRDKAKKLAKLRLPTLEIEIPRTIPLQPLSYLQHIVLDDPSEYPLPNRLQATKKWLHYPDIRIEDEFRSPL